MARNISVKVPTALLIAQLEAKIAEIDAEIADYPLARKDYEASLEHYKTKVAEFVGKFVKANADLIGFDHSNIIRIADHHYSRVELIFDTDAISGFPKKPEEPRKPNQKTYYGRDYTTQRDLLEKNLKILRMTSQEEVNASTYGAIMEIL
jgi:hypothetical protein